MADMKGGGETERYVVDYYMGIHYGICHGPVDALLNVIIKEKDAWPGKTVYPVEPDEDDLTEEEKDEGWEEDDLADGVDDGVVHIDPNAPEIDDVTIMLLKDFIDQSTGGVSEYTGEDADRLPVVVEPQAFPIVRPELFGGDKKEGGVEGVCFWLPGRADQTITEFLAAKNHLTEATHPAYRGIASAWFTWYDASRGFMWCQNNPYLPPAWFRVFRRPRGLNPLKATIQWADNPPDANPAHIIYECLTNKLWGMGASPTMIDIPSFEAAADTLITEHFGLSMGWFEQASIEDFIKEVLDHIQAVLFVKPETGLLTLRLLRADYGFGHLLPLYGPDNCKAINRQRKGWGETINEIVVTFTNWRTEKEETVTVHDQANAAIQGGVVSSSRNYYGVRFRDLAMWLAQRDIASASYPLYAAEIEVDRTAWKLHPGDCIRFTWPEDDLDVVVMRVGAIDYGKLGDPTIRVTLLEDIFAKQFASFITPPATEWEPPETIPKPIQQSRGEFVTLPYSMIVAVTGQQPSDDQYPNTVIGILAARPNADSINFDLVGKGVLPNGSAADVQLGTKNFTGWMRLGAPMTKQATTTIAKTSLEYWGPGFGQPVVGASFGYLGDDENGEIVMFDAESGTGGSNWVLARGMFDTVPKAWPSGTRMWIINSSFDAIDLTRRPAGAPVSYRLRTRTSLGLLPLENTPERTFTPVDRPYLPYRPANAKVDSQAFPVEIEYLVAPTNIVVTWANRNRLTEDVTAKRWAEGNVTPEVDQETNIVFSTPTGTELYRVTGLTGTSTNINYAGLVTSLGGNSEVVLKVVSVRDGLESLQGLEFRLKLTDASYGYGYGYGYDYGGF